MIKFIIFLIIFSIYSIIIFLCGRGYGNAENFQYINNLKRENMMLKNDLSLKCIEDDEKQLADKISDDIVDGILLQIVENKKEKK